MRNAFAQDRQTDIDRPVRDALAERPGKPLKIRLQPMILREPQGRPAQYMSWPQVCWTLECDAPNEVYAARDAMRAFFEIMGRLGPEAVHSALAAMSAATQPRKVG